MTTMHKITLHLQAQPSLPGVEIIGEHGILPMLFEATGKAFSSITGDGVGTAENQNNRVVASINTMTPDSLGETFDLWVEIEAIG